MFQTVCLIAFILNLIMALLKFSEGLYVDFAGHLFCALLCSLGFAEFKRKGE